MAGFIPAPAFQTLRNPTCQTSTTFGRPTFVASPNRRAPPTPSPRRPVLQAVDTLVLTEDNVNMALEEVRVKLGSVFGNSAENRDIGITGDVEFVDMDGPIVVLRLKGRFWHKRADVLARVSAYLTSRIPEICDTQIEDVRQLSDSEEETTRLAID